MTRSNSEASSQPITLTLTRDEFAFLDGILEYGLSKLVPPLQPYEDGELEFFARQGEMTVTTLGKDSEMVSALASKIGKHADALGIERPNPDAQ